MRYKIHSTDLAEQDLERTTDYIAYDLCNPCAAIKLIDGIREKIESLEIWPERHKFDEDLELAKLGIRKILYKNYKIYYIIDECENVVYIIRILHKLENSQHQLYKTFGLKKNKIINKGRSWFATPANLI